VSPRLLAYYHQLQNSIPTASCDGFLLEDKVIITNPSQGWEDFSPKNAVRAVCVASRLLPVDDRLNCRLTCSGIHHAPHLSC
jgi:hypothetical protein